MLKVKSCGSRCSLRSSKTIFVIVLSVFHMQSCRIITSENTVFSNNFEKTDNEKIYSAPSCRPREFKCLDCIPGMLVCDGKVDCYDGKDEAGCWCNAISLIGTEDKILNEGDTFNMTCFVYGEPIPEIAWYRNGEPVPNKCSWTRENRTGVLTCPYVKLADEGIYSCKGIDPEKFTVHARSISSNRKLHVVQKINV